MGAGPPYGNKNAEKWTFKKAIQLYQDAIELTLQEEKTNIKYGEKYIKVVSFKYDFIGEVSKELGTYHQMMTQHLPTRFPKLKRLLNQLVSNLESNCYVNTKKGNIKEATGIVNLKSNHKWTDRQTFEGDINLKKDVSEIFPKELDE